MYGHKQESTSKKWQTWAKDEENCPALCIEQERTKWSNWGKISEFPQEQKKREQNKHIGTSRNSKLLMKKKKRVSPALQKALKAEKSCPLALDKI